MGKSPFFGINHYFDFTRFSAKMQCGDETTKKNLGSVIVNNIWLFFTC